MDSWPRRWLATGCLFDHPPVTGAGHAARLLDLGCRRPPTLRAVLTAAAPPCRAPFTTWATAAGWPLFVSYGMSETAAQVATFTPNDGRGTKAGRLRPCPGTLFVSATMAASVSAARRSCSAILDGGGPDAEGWLTTGDPVQIDGGAA